MTWLRSNSLIPFHQSKNWIAISTQLHFSYRVNSSQNHKIPKNKPIFGVSPWSKLQKWDNEVAYLRWTSFDMNSSFKLKSVKWSAYWDRRNDFWWNLRRSKLRLKLKVAWYASIEEVIRKANDYWTKAMISTNKLSMKRSCFEADSEANWIIDYSRTKSSELLESYSNFLTEAILEIASSKQF